MAGAGAMIVSMASGLVLDFDGTILDTEGPLFRSWAELWEDHGHELALVHWQQFIGTDGVSIPGGSSSTGSGGRSTGPSSTGAVTAATS